jgi:GTPase SAR1 family protein
VRVQFVDTWGNRTWSDFHRYASSDFPPYVRRAHGILFVYDVTNYDSYEEAAGLVLKLEQLAAAKVLVGNKCDLERPRAVTFEDGQNLVR